MEGYVAQIEELGDEVFNANSTVVHGTHKPSAEAVSRMVTDLDKQIKKRAKYSRRRTHNDDDDIDYINSRNAKFNKKLGRYVRFMNMEQLKDCYERYDSRSPSVHVELNRKTSIIDEREVA